ncbi:MAG TPA: EVE domain-containing protein [Candidatus Paceibacterota bacterium]|nr:EVE domain-containing protein [Candidatus Paceibacterota bacterium]
MRYWLMKTEPSCYSIDDLKREKVGMWDDVRNYQARNFMRDMKRGDLVLFYHSSTDPTGIVGVAKIAREAYPDPTQFNRRSYKYDPRSSKNAPRWDAVDVRFVEKFGEPLTLAELKDDPVFSDMLVTRRGNRLSVMPVSETHAKRVLNLRSKGKTP